MFISTQLLEITKFIDLDSVNLKIIRRIDKTKIKNFVAKCFYYLNQTITVTRKVSKKQFNIKLKKYLKTNITEFKYIKKHKFIKTCVFCNTLDELKIIKDDKNIKHIEIGRAHV